jgi:hypothetical protein
LNSENFTATQYGLYQFWLNIADYLSDTPKPVTKIVVSVRTQAGVTISELRTYNIDYNLKNSNELNIFFAKNSLAAFDTFYFTGDSKTEIETESEQFVKALPDEYGIFDAEICEFNKQETDTRTANSGYRTEAEINALRELLLSDEIYFIDKLGTSFNIYKVTTLSSKITTHETDNYLRNLAYTIRIAKIENAFGLFFLDNFDVTTFYSTKGDFNDDFNNDFFN